MRGPRPESLLRFVQLHAFAADWKRHGLSDEDLRALEMAILVDPKVGSVVQGTGGLRKVRFAQPGSKRGKSGSYRVCYVAFEEFGVILLVTAYGKGERDDLSMADRHAISDVIGRARDLLQKGRL